MTTTPSNIGYFKHESKKLENRGGKSPVTKLASLPQTWPRAPQLCLLCAKESWHDCHMTTWCHESCHNLVKPFAMHRWSMISIPPTWYNVKLENIWNVMWPLQPINYTLGISQTSHYNYISNAQIITITTVTHASTTVHCIRTRY